MIHWYWLTIVVIGVYLFFGLCYALPIVLAKYKWLRHYEIYMREFRQGDCWTKEQMRDMSYSGFWKNFFRWPLVVVTFVWAVTYWSFKKNGVPFSAPQIYWIGPIWIK